MKNNNVVCTLLALSLLSTLTVNAAPKQTVQFTQAATTQQQNYAAHPTTVYDYNNQMSQNNYNYSAPLQGHVVFVPAGSHIQSVSTSEISTETAVQGQAVSFTLPSGFVYNGQTVAPAGSMVNGTVTIAKKASFATRNGQLQIRFTNITTPYGQMIPISGYIMTDDATGIIKGGTKTDTAKEYAKDIAIGSAAGAVIGTALGPLSGGSVGMGAVYGTVLGAGAGLGKSLIDKGGNVVIPANANVNIVIDQPITYSPQQGRRY